MFRTVKSYISSRKALSPVQRHSNATALGNLAVSSVLPGLVLEPKYTSPVGITSCTTLPLPSFIRSLTSRSACRWVRTMSNCPAATLANAVYSPSVPKIHG